MPKTYIKTDAHHHRPVEEPGEWLRICEQAARDPDLVLGLKLMAMSKVTPDAVHVTARYQPFTGDSIYDKPMACEHLDHYRRGRGATLIEDSNINKWIRRDDVRTNERWPGDL